jgi:hypothetical protein
MKSYDYIKAYSVAESMGMNETDSHEFALDMTTRGEEKSGPSIQVNIPPTHNENSYEVSHD